MLPILIVVGVVAVLVVVLGAIVRFSIVSSWRTRGAMARLRQPDPSGVERVCGFPPPTDLVQLYREGTLISLVEFTLVDSARQPVRRWFFGGFYPLTRRDVLEQGNIHGIANCIPIADDMDKGVYFVTRDGRVMFRHPGRKPAEIEVAPSAEALSRFQVTCEDA